jgi:SpoVK/Ycf46/Vps4 family AAA+-type ATPase
MSKATADELRLLMRSGWRLIVLETFEEDRALGLLEKVAAANEAPLVRWSLASGLSGGKPAASGLEAGLRGIETHTGPAIFALLDVHSLLGDPLAVRRLRELLPSLASRQQAVVLVGPALELPVELVREAGRLELPLPNGAELRALFERAIEKTAKREPQALDEAVRAALGLTAAEAVRALRRACRVAGGLDGKAVSEIVRDKRRALRRTPALSFHEVAADLAQVGGLSELKRWLFERRRAFSEEARRFGLPTPRGLLLFGVQGCGKSLCAKAVAREWRFPLLRLDVASAFGGASQSPEAALREAVQVAESLAPAVLWIDEIEKGFAASATDARASRVFGSFLTWLAEKETPVFVVATANDVAGIPPELLRRGRFDELFFVDLPSAAERAEILGIHLRQRGRDPTHYRLDELAAQSERLTGAELEQAVITALFHAFEQSRELEEEDIANALHETVALYDTYEERIKELRDWARVRARPASIDPKLVDLFARA